MNGNRMNEESRTDKFMKTDELNYDEFPGFTDAVDGAVTVETTGDEIGVHYLHDVEYARINGVTLHLQLLLPFTRNHPEKRYPCLVFIQGSAWKKQDVWIQCPLIAGLSRKGYVVAVAEYRHSGIAPFPAQIQDAKNAIRFMKLHAEEYHVDSDAVFAGGDSSGGHTAVFCGIIKDGDVLDDSLYPGVSADAKGILDYYGCVSLLTENGYPSSPDYDAADSPSGILMGGVDLRQRPDLKAKMSAETYFKPGFCMPPTMIVHGTKDRIVGTKISVELYRRMKQCGFDVRLYLLEGADHGGAEFWTPQMCSCADEFMKQVLSKTGESRTADADSMPSR